MDSKTYIYQPFWYVGIWSKSMTMLSCCGLRKPKQCEKYAEPPECRPNDVQNGAQRRKQGRCIYQNKCTCPSIAAETRF